MCTLLTRVLETGTEHILFKIILLTSSMVPETQVLFQTFIKRQEKKKPKRNKETGGRGMAMVVSAPVPSFPLICLCRKSSYSALCHIVKCSYSVVLVGRSNSGVKYQKGPLAANIKSCILISFISINILFSSPFSDFPNSQLDPNSER